MIMKKEYMKPDMQVVELRGRNNLLAGSDRYIDIKQSNFVEDEMEDL